MKKFEGKEKKKIIIRKGMKEIRGRGWGIKKKERHGKKTGREKKWTSPGLNL